MQLAIIAGSYGTGVIVIKWLIHIKISTMAMSIIQDLENGLCPGCLVLTEAGAIRILAWIIIT